MTASLAIFAAAVTITAAGLAVIAALCLIRAWTEARRGT